MNERKVIFTGNEDPNGPIEIADRVWWVGAYLKGDSFQCHPYLIENGEDSVLLDPGSALTFKETFKKVEQIIPFTKIRYFVCHHQDPDITGMLTMIDSLVNRSDAAIVSHWRAEALLRHYGLQMPFYRVEEHDWQLQLQDRLLKFIYTPYLHFPGAFTTFDTHSGVLFSSDIFGGFTEEFRLLARDESSFEGIKLFHEHYMPSRDILLHSMLRIETYPITMIAPQHGSIIPQHLVKFLIDKLKNIDCGLYLLAETETNIHMLSKMNKILRDIMETMVLYRDFSDIANALMVIIKRILPIVTIEFYTIDEDSKIFHFAQVSRFEGAAAEIPEKFTGILGMDLEEWHKTYEDVKVVKDTDNTIKLICPLFSPNTAKIKSIAILTLEDEVIMSDEVSKMLNHLSLPLEVAIEREFLFRKVEHERKEIYERSIRDQLTGMFNRIYMHDVIKRSMYMHDRDKNLGISVILFDIDHFKSVNDTYGHNAGDRVLKEVAAVMLRKTRNSDLPVRLGGEEFAIFNIGPSCAHSYDLGERIRVDVSKLTFDAELAERKITISAGIAFRRQNETLEEFIHRADAKLYEAKESGRNRICIDNKE